MENDPTSQKRKRVNPSPAWEYFTRTVDKDKPKAVCNYCGVSYAAHVKNSGTSNLLNHARNCKKLLATLDETQKKLFLCKKEAGEASPSGTLVVKTFSEKRCRDKLARMIVEDKKPFKSVESKGFREYSRELEPRFIVPSRKTVASDIFKIYYEEKIKLKSFFASLSSRVCLTTDTWTSIQNKNYMVITAHFVDANWNLTKRIINFCEIADHKGDTIATMLGKSLLECGIERIMTITVDNASSNDAALRHLISLMKNQNELVLDGKFVHIRCFAHILNLIVGNGLKEHNESIMKIRKAVKYVDASPARLIKFKACVESANITSKSLLRLDVPTRWNSTYLMLEAAEKFELAFERLQVIDSHYVAEFFEDGANANPPTKEDWHRVREFMIFLKEFYETTLKVSVTSQATAHVFFSEVCKIHRLLKKHASSEIDSLRTMAYNMKVKYEKYWGDFSKVNQLMYVAVVLDPRYKEKYVQYCLLKMHGQDFTNAIMLDLDRTIRRLYSEYAKQTQQTSITTSSVTSRLQCIVEDDDYEQGFRESINNNDGFISGNEIENYLNAKLEHFQTDTEILTWWKMHTVDYPILSKMAKDVLAIPISTVASESAFSCGGRVLDSFRSSLAPTTVECLICLQSWIRDSGESKSFEEELEEVTQYDKDLHDCAQGVVTGLSNVHNDLCLT